MKKRKVIDDGPSLFPEWNEETEAEPGPAAEEVQTKSLTIRHSSNALRNPPSAVSSSCRPRIRLIFKEKVWLPSVVMPLILWLSVWHPPSSPMMASKHPCGVILYFLLNMPRDAAAEGALPSGTIYPQAECPQQKNSNMR